MSPTWSRQPSPRGDALHALALGLARRRCGGRLALAGALALAAGLAGGSLAPEARACPSCNEAPLRTGGEDLARGFGWSILFLLAIPFGVVGGFGAWAWYATRPRAGATEALADASGPAGAGPAAVGQP